MKIVKIILAVLLVLVALVFIVALISPKSYDVHRTVQIDAPREFIFTYVQYLKKNHQCSPWAEKDSMMKTDYSEIDGQVGSEYSWQGDPQLTGKGKMIITKIVPNEQVEYDLIFEMPRPSKATGYTLVADSSGVSEVTWGVKGNINIPFNLILLFSNMESMIAPDFEKGLSKLKTIAEETWKLAKNYELKQIEFPEINYAIIRDTLSMNGLSSFFQNSYGAIYEGLGKQRIRPTGTPCGLYFTFDEETMITELAAAVPIAIQVSPTGLDTFHISATKAWQVDYLGPYDQSMGVYYAADYFFAKSGLKQKMPVIEEYITDPAQEPDPSKWLTRITFFTE